MSEARGPERLRDRDWLHEQYHGRRRSAVGIAAELGCSSDAVHKALRHAKIPAKFARKVARRFPRLSDGAWLREQYIDCRRSLSSIGDEIGCSKQAVAEALRSFGVERRHGGHYRGLDPASPWRHLYQITDEEEATLRRLYLEEKLSVIEIARRFHCDRHTIRRRLVALKIPVRPYNQHIPEMWDAETLRRLYVDEGYCQETIAAHLGVDQVTVSKALRRAMIPTRPRGKRCRKEMG